MILALAGGVGGAKLAAGLAAVLPPQELTIVVNTGDDFVHLGLAISPDVDTVMYTLAGLSNPETGWGIANETWRFMSTLERLGGETWFRLGDQDLATHVERTRRLKTKRLSEVTEHLCNRLGVRHRIVPMSDEPAATVVHTTSGPLSFQDYFVRQRSEPKVIGFTYNSSKVAPSSGFLTALLDPTLTAIVICPSNPYLSIFPMLSLPGIREALSKRVVPCVAVSPIVGGKAIKGPAAKLMQELGAHVSPLGIAAIYRGLIDGLVMDEQDAALQSETTGATHVTQTVMKELADSARLARSVMGFAKDLSRRMSREDAT